MREKSSHSASQVDGFYRTGGRSLTDRTLDSDSSNAGSIPAGRILISEMASDAYYRASLVVLSLGNCVCAVERDGK